jgi:raffinose/stachyose/melibiose transport system permease protein
MRATGVGKYTLVLLMATAWLILSGMPFYFMAQTGFKEQFELLARSVWAPPVRPTVSNYSEVLSGNFLIYLRNSLVVVSVSVIIVLVVGAMAAYVFARIRFRLSGLLFALVVAGLIIPVHVTLIPVFLLSVRLGIHDTLWALIGPYVAFNLPLTVFLLTEFMREIPKELEDAARMDGAGHVSIFIKIILPLSVGGLATLAIYNAVFMWNEFVFAYILTSRPNIRTLPLALWEYQGQYASNVPMIMAILTLSALPIIVAYLVGQERLVKGLMAGAIKG